MNPMSNHVKLTLTINLLLTTRPSNLNLLAYLAKISYDPKEFVQQAVGLFENLDIPWQFFSRATTNPHK